MGGDLKIAAVSAPPLDRGAERDDARAVSSEMKAPAVATTAACAPATSRDTSRSSSSATRLHGQLNNDGSSAAAEELVVRTTTTTEVEEVAHEESATEHAASNGFHADPSSRNSNDDDGQHDEGVATNVENGVIEINITTDDSDEVEADTTTALILRDEKSTEQKAANKQNQVVELVESDAAALEVAIPADLEVKASQREVQRKRKRSKRLGFSGSKPKQKRQGICPPLQTQLADANEAHDDDNMDAPESPILKESTALYEPKSSEAVWDWSMAAVYYNPIVQENLDHLVRARKNCANVLAANAALYQDGQLATTDTAQLRAMLADADDTVSARVRPLRRGRHYRDIWEEEDFLNAGHKRGAFSVDKKKCAFGDQELLVSNHDLVHGYDDELFVQFIHRLETQAGKATAAAAIPTATHRGAPPKHAKGCEPSDLKPKSKQQQQHASLNEVILPDVPVQQCHPAAWGNWIIKKPKPKCQFDIIHPASLSRKASTSRWKEESDVLEQLVTQHERAQSEEDDDGNNSEHSDDTVASSFAISTALWGNGTNDTSHLPSFGHVIEEDDVSREIAASLAKLIPLSMHNWRLAQTVYERATCHAQCAPILRIEAALEKRIEDLYRRLYPPLPPTTPADQGGGVMDQDARRPVFHSRPIDVITHSTRSCKDPTDEMSNCVAASVKYALSLQMGDEVDVLDRNGCWNDGVVVDLYREHDCTTNTRVKHLKPFYLGEAHNSNHKRRKSEVCASSEFIHVHLIFFHYDMWKWSGQNPPSTSKNTRQSVLLGEQEVLCDAAEKLREKRCKSQMALQRKNFRCPRDGLSSPIYAASSSTSSHHAGVVISHAELPPRQRKRLQVGSTNLSKNAFTTDAATTELKAEGDLSSATRHVCATNIDLLKATLHNPKLGNLKQELKERAQSSMGTHIVRTEQRRLRSMTPSSSASRLEGSRNNNVQALDNNFQGTGASTETLAHDNASHHDSKNHHHKANGNDTMRQMKQRALFLANRKKLYEAFVEKYGSMRAVFKAFDSDGDGVISFQRFQKMVEVSEVGLTPDETREMYTQVDTNGDNAMEYQEFAQMFTSSELSKDVGYLSPMHENDGIASDPSSSLMLKYRSPLELSPRSRERMKALRSQVTEQLANKHGLEVNIHGGKNEQLLMYAFKQRRLAVQ
ncbi:Calmodulin protein, partial [Globisporangium splendens]